MKLGGHSRFLSALSTGKSPGVFMARPACFFGRGEALDSTGRSWAVQRVTHLSRAVRRCSPSQGESCGTLNEAKIRVSRGTHGLKVLTVFFCSGYRCCSESQM